MIEVSEQTASGVTKIGNQYYYFDPDTHDTCRGGKSRRKSIETRTCKGINGGENSSGKNGKADLPYIGGGF